MQNIFSRWRELVDSFRKKYLFARRRNQLQMHRQRFYLPVAVQDAFDSETKLSYDDYHLAITKTEDALQNIASAETIDYRTLQATILKDINDNISEIITDELGMVIATSVHGDESRWQSWR